MSKGLDLLFFLGRPFSPIYSFVMKSREKLYTSGFFRQHIFPVPIISIGNLVLGGTGKTPTVQHVARLLLNHGYHPAIISRGHGGKARDAVNIVSDGQNIFLSAQLAGDEPSMLAQSLPGVPVLTGSRRIFPCAEAIARFSSDILILDDGFQHLSVKRDIDLVLFDATELAGNSRVFPGGPLREPTFSLKRCDAFLLTGRTFANQERAEKFSDLLQQKFAGRPVFMSAVNSARLLGPDGNVCDDTSFNNFFGFCGIANPSRFEKSINDLGIRLKAFFPLKDHTSYNRHLIANLCKKAIELGATRLVTTEKDFVKLRDYELQLPLYVLQIQHKVEQAFDQFVLNALRKMEKRASSDN